MVVVDQQLLEYLKSNGVTIRDIDWQTTIEAEQSWREKYGRAFAGRPRLRQGVKAETEYSQTNCSHYCIIPFSSNVNGTPIQVRGPRRCGLECHGALVALGQFHAIEFFISPPDLEWTMVHTHEDHAYGGPYFVRMEWIP